MLRRTRIVCTLGPASVHPGILRQLISAGMDVARFNFSHGGHELHRHAVAAVRAAASATGNHLALLQDLQGPKIRTGSLVQPSVQLKRGNEVMLGCGQGPGDASMIPVSHPELVEALEPRDRVLLADGQIELRVRHRNGQGAECVVVRGGVLGERKGVVVPGRALPLPALTVKDLADLELGADLVFDYLALSFVRSAEDVESCRAAVRQLGWKVPIVAKLERKEALAHLDGILAAADAVMVARGDLGVELPLGQLPAVQKDLIERANRAGVPVITATEMLESMVSSNRPTRAEASDVANAIWDGTDAVMLSQETSIGAHPVEAVQAMATICRAAEAHPSYLRTRQIWHDPREVGSAIAHAAATVAVELKVRAIVAFTESGMTARRISKAHPVVPVLAVSPHRETLRRTALYSGVIPLQVEQGRDTDDMVAKATAAAVASGLVRKGDRVVVVAGAPVGQTGVTNLVKVETVP